MKPATTLRSFEQLSVLNKPTTITGKIYSRKTNTFLKLSPYQKMLYAVALSGTAALDPIQEKRLSKHQRRSIELLSSRANRILNMWKSQMITNTVSSLYNKLFPTAPITPALSILMMPVKCNEFEPNLSFKELGVSMKQIIDKLIHGSVLPDNFYELA